MPIALKKKAFYPYITFNPNVANGAPSIQGTRITVQCIAGYHQLGMTVDEILNALQQLTPAQVHSALTYYFDHQLEVDRDLAEASDEEFWKRQVVKPAKRGRKRETEAVAG